MREKFLEQSYNFAMSISQSWWMHANRLLRSSYTLLKYSLKAKEKFDDLPLEQVREINPGTEEFELFENSELCRDATLLLALSLENMFKALWVEQNFQKIKNNENLPNKIRTHNLIKLADKTGIQLSGEEREGLKILSKHSMWIAKYPIPLSRNEYVEDHGKISIVWIKQKYPESIDFPDEVYSIIQKIWHKVEALQKMRDWKNE